jgi:ribosomal protein S4
MVKLKFKKKYVTRFRIVRTIKKDPWGVSLFLRRRLFLRSLHTYYKIIKDMRRKRNFSNVLLLDRSRGKIKKRIRRKSLYGRMLMNKQGLQKFYNVYRSKRLRMIFRDYSKGLSKTPFTKKLVSFLELRLDNVLRRCYFVPTVHWARQSIVHGKLRLNDTIFVKPSVKLLLGQEFTLPREIYNFYNIRFFFKKLRKYLKPLPNFLLVDYKNLRFFIIATPSLENIFYPFKANFSNLIQFYQNRRR